MRSSTARGLGRLPNRACIHCARVVFRRARRLGEIQLTMIESHVLVCRPLATLQCADDVLAHCRITETPER